MHHASTRLSKDEMPIREVPWEDYVTPIQPDIISALEYMKSIPQAKQRSEEWFAARRNYITASNAYKAFQGKGGRNQLIYEKCSPPIPIPTNLESPMHWGQKYEPVTQMLYEKKFNTTIEEFGCIPHKDFPFLAASPDGIVTNELLPRYGHMIEIKNPVSRDLKDGKAPPHYFVQMQLQMEVCNLDVCDYVETKFREITLETFLLTNTTKGIILHFQTREGDPVYEYKPIGMDMQQFTEEWFPVQLQKHEFYQKTIYWELVSFTCVVYPRNRQWFSASLAELKSVWDEILAIRDSPEEWEKRAPKKRCTWTPDDIKEEGTEVKSGVSMRVKRKSS